MALRKVVQINSISGLCLTKLDVLDGLETIKICVGYGGGNGDNPDVGSEYYEEVEPVYEELPGWQESTAGARNFDDLPANAQAYIRRVEEAVGAPIDIISTGRDRNETILLKDPFA